MTSLQRTTFQGLKNFQARYLHEEIRSLLSYFIFVCFVCVFFFFSNQSKRRKNNKGVLMSTSACLSRPTHSDMMDRQTDGLTDIRRRSSPYLSARLCMDHRNCKPLLASLFSFKKFGSLSQQPSCVKRSLHLPRSQKLPPVVNSHFRNITVRLFKEDLQCT